jgi:hypothetical protein
MTRNVIALLAVGFAALSGSVAENHAEMQPPRDASQALQDLEHRWVEALVKADTNKLAAILGNRFVDTDEEGHRTDKRGVLGALESGGRDRRGIANRHIQGSTPGASDRIHRHLCTRERELESGCVPPIRRAQAMRWAEPLVDPRAPEKGSANVPEEWDPGAPSVFTLSGSR